MRTPPASNRLLTLLMLGLVLLLALLWGSRPLVHDDLFFHLATGEYVVEHHAVPKTDPFSFTRGGERWISHEWGFGLVSRLLWSAGGFRALVMFKAGLVVTILLVLLALMQVRANRSLLDPSPGHVALLAIGLWAVQDQLILRASLVSSLLVLVLLWLLYRFDRTGSRATFIAIATLFVLWGNLHGEVLFGLFLLGVFTFEGLLARFRHAVPVPASLLRASPSRPYPTLFLVAFFATLINPNGIQVLLYPFRLAGFLLSRGETLEMGHFTGATPAAAGGFYLLLAILLFSMLPLERLRGLALTDVVTVAVFLVLALRSHRFIFYFVLFALPVIACLLAEPVARRLGFLRSPTMGFLATGMVALAVAATAAAAWSDRDPRTVSRHFPRGAVELLQREGVEGHGFNHQNYGGYSYWSLRRPIFWDGRNLLFGPLMEQVRQMPLAEVASTWDLDYLLLTEFEFSRMGDQVDPARWGLVHWDDFAALYLGRGERNDRILEHLELRQFPPFGGFEGLNTRALDDAWATDARRELAQILGLEPECQRALYLEGLISLYRGELQQAERSLLEALEIGPNEHVTRALDRLRANRI